jgi:hypothetical protein
MKKTFFSKTIIVFLLLCSGGLQAQDNAKDLDQLKLIQKYYVGTWQITENDTTYVSSFKQDGNVLLGTDYIIVDGKKSAYSYWIFSYKPERDNFYIFQAYVSGGCETLIGSFTAENKWCHESFAMFNRDKSIGKQEIVFNTPTSCTVTTFNADGAKQSEDIYTKVE